MLQHFGSPTRLLDITFNSLVGAFFATEEHAEHDKADARLFAIDVTDRLINENKNLRDWEDAIDTPWSTSFISDHFRKLKSTGHKFASPISEDEFKNNWLHEWSSHFYAWRPPALDARIAAQNGGFVFGGIVGTSLREGYLDTGIEGRRAVFQLVDPDQKDARLTIDDTRRLTCLAIQPKPFPTSPIRKNSPSSVYCIRIESKGKVEIRSKLRQIFGYTHSTIYPDFSGFSQFGVGSAVRGTR
jgi:FRG domain